VLDEAGEGRVVIVEVGAYGAAAAIDGVEAAPEDPVVGAQPVVVEAVAGVADPLAPPPADRLPLEVGDEPGQVLPAEPLQQLDLVAEAGEAVLQAVGERADQEATVATARRSFRPINTAIEA
jgi:hypothetical protein